MFREMRRKRQALDAQWCREALDRGTSGVLAVLGDGGYPYAVPLSYVRDGGRLYFHCAKAGHKLDAVRREPKASFCVIDRDEVAPEAYTSRYRSVIAFGRVRELTDADEKRRAVELLARKYAPDDTEERRARAIADDWDGLCMLELTVEHMTGKQERGLAQGQ